ncbi:glycosyltransferase family 2 protein [Oceanicola sp. 502str15]|uniref:glycosyltransferase family 2 protein n=1 Tax=Oceanicola sp. 502str15 TaxID=2696061 RepID=UPI0020957424|nr:glycosyltransferase family 2 protein [Oceanicola sp. 502str15]MCO6381961.1 glycosyltransferase family 92 protein [Oceanicola sp. 502str15]
MEQQEQSEMRVTSITPMKNEGPYILEWVAHNRAIGINDMLVFTNHCTDGTDLILERLDEMGLVRHMPNPSIMMPAPRHHIALTRYVNEMTRLRRSDWVTNLDADEFVRVNTGKGRLEDLFNAVPDAHCITLSLHTFGCGWVDEIAPDDKMVTETFTYRGDSERSRNPVKYIARGDFPWVKFSNNSPAIEEADLDRVNWVNGSGTRLSREQIAEPFKGMLASESGFDLVDVAHYTIRSYQGFLVQRDRGSANPMKGRPEDELDLEQALKYWRRFNKNDVKDESFAALPGLRDAVEELLKDAELRSLHEAALAWHRNRAQELLQKPDYRELHDTIRGLPEDTRALA